MTRRLLKIIHRKQLCESWLVCKQASMSFLTRTSFRAERPLQLVHADFCRPTTPPLIVRNKYFLLLVDDYSRWMWVYKLKEKGEALCAFKIFKDSLKTSLITS